MSAIRNEMMRMDPDRYRLLPASRYHERHVDSLLNQTLDLAEIALRETTEWMNIKRAGARYKLELASKSESLKQFEKEFNLTKSRLRRLAELTNDRLADSKYDFENGQNHAEIGYREAPSEYGRVQAAMALMEWKLQGYQRVNESNAAAADIAHAQALDEINTFKIESLQRQKSEFDRAGQNDGLNYERDLDYCEARVRQSWNLAAERAVIAELGLRRIFGWDGPKLDVETDRPLPEMVNILLIWVREAIAWVAAFLQLEQSQTTVVSLRSKTDANRWKLFEAYDGTSWAFEIDLRREYFSDQSSVRLKGVAATYLGESVAPLRVRLFPPVEALYRHAGGRVEFVNQRQIPPCLLGRVENRTAFRPPEVCGLISLMNVSPVGVPESRDGTWRLEIESDGKLKGIGDVVVEIYTTGTPLV